MDQHVEIAEVLMGYFPPEYRGVFLEVGAAHPVDYSISHIFRNGGWKIVSIEPNPEFVQEFTKLGWECLPYACCAEDRGQTNFYVSPCPMSSSALEVRYPGNYPLENHAGGWWPADKFKAINVEALTLNTVLKRHHPGIGSIDILMVDTEGWELDVLDGFDLAEFRPRVVVLEEASPIWATNTLTTYAAYMEERGYRKDREVLQDKFFVRKSS